MIEKNYKSDDLFIEKVFNLFVLVKNKKIDVFKDKIKFFIEDVKSEKDIIWYFVLKFINNLDIIKNDFENVMNFINIFNFKENEIDVIFVFLEKIGKINDERVIFFFENYYKKEFIKIDV